MTPDYDRDTLDSGAVRRSYVSTHRLMDQRTGDGAGYFMIDEFSYSFSADNDAEAKEKARFVESHLEKMDLSSFGENVSLAKLRLVERGRPIDMD